MAPTGKGCTDVTRRRLKAAALIVSLGLSAFFLAVATGSTAGPWLAWISLLPLFRAIRVLTPVSATLAGAGWGVCVYICGVAGAVPALAPTPLSFALLTAVPAAYAGLAALATRAVGFNPLLLGLGWVLVEIALRPLGLHQGLLAGTQAGSSLAHWIGRAFGYVFVALLVAWANASLLAVLSGARWTIPRIAPFTGHLASGDSFPPPQVSSPVPVWTLRQLYPRAPPLRRLAAQR